MTLSVVRGAVKSMPVRRSFSPNGNYQVIYPLPWLFNDHLEVLDMKKEQMGSVQSATVLALPGLKDLEAEDAGNVANQAMTGTV